MSIRKGGSNTLVFMSRLLTMVNLPYRNIYAPDWERSNGIVTIHISSGYENGEIIGIPYGIYARLILFYIVTEAVKSKSPIIYLGDSFNNFIKNININKKGGHQINSIRHQLQKMLSCEFSWIQQDKSYKFSISDTYKIFENYVYLNKEFYDEIIKSPIPLDFEIIKQLKNSPMCIDLYMLLTWRTFKLKNQTFISWKNIEFQLGSQYEDSNNFIKKCIKYISIIKNLCPHMNIEIGRGRIILNPR